MHFFWMYSLASKKAEKTNNL